MGNSMEYVLRMENITKQFTNTLALNNVSLNVSKGETVSIIGPSGSGKSTLLRCINRLEKITSGSIYIGDDPLVITDATGKTAYASEANIRRICSNTGMVFQSFNLFPHFTCLKNIWYAPVKLGKSYEEKAIEEAKELLNLVGLSDKENAYPEQLSGGQKQRVAIARALALHPKILLFDEPTSALDPELTGEVLQVIKKLAQEHMTMLIVTHEMSFARDVSDIVVFMDNGAVIESGPPDEIFKNPQMQRTAEFLSNINL